MNRDELSARLLETFATELEEQLRSMNADLLALEANPADAERLKSVFRAAHNLKGAARAAGVRTIEQTCHALETLLSTARNGELQLGPGGFSLLFSVLDALSNAGTEIKSGRDPAPGPLTAVRDRLKRWRPQEAAPVETRSLPVSGSIVERAESDVRVAVEKLDAVFAGAAQLVVARGSAAEVPTELVRLHEAAVRSAGEWARTSRQLRIAVERSSLPAALASAIGGMDASFKGLVDELGRLAAVAANDARSFARAADEVADGVHRLRLRPFAQACEALPRIVRDLATTGHKEVDLEVIGGDAEIDGAVLAGLREALLHLTRNAVDHGIEAPAKREQLGKSGRGKVTIAATLHGGTLRVTVTDDGAGLDLSAIRRRLEQRGLPIPPTDRDVAQALFTGGFSTKDEATTISGRGIGLDVVRTAMERMRGTAEVSWIPDRSTTFTLECPQSLATLRAVLAIVGPQLIAVPTMHVERLLQVDPADIKQAEGREVVLTAEDPVPLVALGRLLSPIVQRASIGRRPVVVLRVGSRRLAVAVDELVREDEVVLRSIDQAGALPHVSGAAIIGTGEIALVLNPVALVETGLNLAGDGALGVTPPERIKPRRRILLVDDSITTRTLEQSILDAAGYDVATAVDGADGWRVLQERSCDLVVADVEMPRMDGFSLCQAIRGSKRFKDLPVVLVTALETPEHRARGFEVGADAYLGKSSFDQQALLDAIEQLLGEP